MSKEYLSAAQQGFVAINTAHCKWSFNNFESWMSQIAGKESFSDDVLLTDDLDHVGYPTLSWEKQEKWSTVM